MASIPPAANSSAIPRASCRWAKRRSSPGWSRRRRRYSPTADVQAAVGRANVVIDADAQIRRDRARTRPRGRCQRGQAGSRKQGQNSVRYFTDWVLPQLDLLLPETNEPLEVWTTLDPGHAARRDRCDQGQHAQGRAGRAGRAWTATARCSRMVGGTDYVDDAITTARPTPCASRDRRGSCSSISPRWRQATRPTTGWSTNR